ncbi:MAG: MBL fold metallo-hydrolase [Deltaproteobacteria bacterium]|jgi:glyoxylase-like metal-dependent hydrolase (beta-lactamase superfamily II)|nr:MBL fold metallo-hydrolase [Deltaproteobacteria bacterium]
MKPLFFFTAVFVLALVALAPGVRKALADAEGGWHTAQYGDLAVTALSDSTGMMPFTIFYDITAEDFEALAAAGGSPSANEVPSWINAFLVKKGDELFLVDTGMGVGPSIVPLVSAAGYSPDQVTHVLITHFHSDHIGGLLDGDGSPSFPNATLYAPVRDEEYFIPKSGPDVNGTELARKVTGPYRSAGRYRAFDPGAQIAPGVKSSSLWGHTPGHTGFAFESSAGPLLCWGDVVHAYLIQFSRPEVTLSYDVDRPGAAATRRKVFNEAADGRWLVAGAHLPFPAIGQVTRRNGGFVWSPYQASETEPAGGAPASGADGPPAAEGSAPTAPAAD